MAMAACWRQILARATGVSPALRSRFHSTRSPYFVKVGIPEFLHGIGKGVETHVAKLESEIGDLNKLLITRTLRLKELGIPCKHNLTTWGGALLELAQLQSGPECVNMVKEAVLRLDEALEIKPRKHDTLWCLGNAHTAQAFLTTDQEMAKMYFTKAVGCFQRAASEDPGNELYLQSLKVTEKFTQTPELPLEIQRQAISQQAAAAAPSTSSAKVPKNNKSSDLMYDICGWIILAIGVIACVGMAKSNVPPPSPR